MEAQQEDVMDVDDPDAFDEVKSADILNEPQRCLFQDVRDILEIENEKVILHKPINEYDTATKRRLNNDYQIYMDTCHRFYLKSVAAGQEEAVENYLKQEKLIKNEIIEAFKTAYDSCLDNKSRILVLSCVPTELCGKQELMQKLKCTKRCIDEARNLFQTIGACGFKDKAVVKRNRLDYESAKHFVTYLLHTEAIEFTAYLTVSISYDDGSSKTIPRPVLQRIQENVVSDYEQLCARTGQSCLSRTTLLKILQLYKPSKKKALAGLDYFLVDLLNSFKLLKRINIDYLDNDTALLEKIKRVERYLKSQYKLNCFLDNECASHCISHGLSHPTDKNFQEKCTKTHDKVCKSCVECTSLFDDMRKKVLQVNEDYRNKPKASPLMLIIFNLAEITKKINR